MPSRETRAHLAALYAGADDPWDTHSSAYEGMKFTHTMASLPRERYRRGLEVGCGAGALTALLAVCCDELVAMDCTARALAVARARLSHANVTFLEGTAPTIWPAQPPDLVLLSEVLYFMTEAESAGLALRLARNCAPDCDVVLVNWLGDTGGSIGGASSALRLTRLLAGTHRELSSRQFAAFHIVVLRGTGARDASALGPDLIG